MSKKMVVRRKLVAPAWDENSVMRQGNDLWVEAEGGGFEPLSRWVAAGFGVSDFLADFEDAPRRSRETSQRLPHVRFMNSTDDGKLVDFVSDFGPVLALWVKANIEPVFTRFIQDMSVLGAQQKMFAAARSLVRLVNDLNDFSRTIAMDNSEPDYERLSIKLRISPAYSVRLAKIKPALELMETTLTAAVRESKRAGQADEFQTASPDMRKLQPSDCDVANLSTAHQLLCKVFNLFTPKLYYADGVVQECPEGGRTGIRPQLYFLLREVYLAKHRIRRCKRDDCGEFFMPDRGNAEYCSEQCANLARQRSFSAHKALKSKAAVRVD